MKKTYMEPICRMNWVSPDELLTVAGSGEGSSIGWGDVDEEVVL